MDPSSGFSNRPPAVFSDVEIEACRALFQLQLPRKKPRTLDGLLESLPPSWAVKRPRTQRFAVSNYDNKEGKRRNAEETEETRKVRKEARSATVRKIRIVRKRPRPERVAMEAEPVFKAPPPPPQEIFVGSPTSPLLHGSISVSSHGEPSDSNNSLGPSPTSPLSQFQLKVETKAKVHSSPNSRGPKRKTAAELKQRVNEQLMLKEELERERKMLVDCHESLMDENKRLKEQLVLKSDQKEEGKLFICSFDSSEQTMLPHSRVNHTSSGRAILPDLNIPLEDTSDNSSDDFDNEIIKADKLVAAANARKYRVEYLRYKQSQSGNVHSK